MQAQAQSVRRFIGGHVDGTALAVGVIVVVGAFASMVIAAANGNSDPRGNSQSASIQKAYFMPEAGEGRIAGDLLIASGSTR
jgi:hypothetical protein